MIYNTLNFRTEDAVAVNAGMLESGSKVVTKGYLTKWKYAIYFEHVSPS